MDLEQRYRSGKFGHPGQRNHQIGQWHPGGGDGYEGLWPP
jgi:hypothetical protein